MSKPIAGDFIETETELSVTLPTVEGLLGDKLTAFAPRTIGVPFETSSGQSMAMQVVKQLYDIGELFNIATDFNDVSSAFKATFIKETGYRKDEFTEKQVLQDTINTCLALCQIRLKGFKSNTDTDYLEDGIRRLSSHLLNEKFRTDIEAKIFASKVFCIANKILNNNSFDFSNSRYNLDKIEQIKDIQLSAPYERLNRLKQILPEAFYYIWQGIIE